MNNVDLHVHSTASDGTLTPSEVVRLAMETKLSAFALTDHDTLHGVNEAIQEAKKLHSEGYDLEVIPGIELSVGYLGHDIHIVGLYIDQNRPEFQAFLDTSITNRRIRNETMLKNLQKIGIPITMNDLTEGNDLSVITRAHFAKHLLKIGIVKTKDEAFQKYLDTTSPYYVPKVMFSPEESIRQIHDAGGIAILAHPMLYNMSHSKIDTMVATLKSAGLDGVEVLYCKNTSDDNHFLKLLAEKYQLLPSGGSDFHGTNKPGLCLGTGYGNLAIPYDILKQIKERLHRQI